MPDLFNELEKNNNAGKKIVVSVYYGNTLIAKNVFGAYSRLEKDIIKLHGSRNYALIYPFLVNKITVTDSDIFVAIKLKSYNQ